MNEPIGKDDFEQWLVLVGLEALAAILVKDYSKARCIMQRHAESFDSTIGEMFDMMIEHVGDYLEKPLPKMAEYN